MLTAIFSGVIPRAAAALFERLGSGSAGRNSGIRAPVRYSTSMATLQKNNPDKGWTMKATYVEVCCTKTSELSFGVVVGGFGNTRDGRFIMSS